MRTAVSTRDAGKSVTRPPRGKKAPTTACVFIILVLVKWCEPVAWNAKCLFARHSLSLHHDQALRFCHQRFEKWSAHVQHLRGPNSGLPASIQPTPTHQTWGRRGAQHFYLSLESTYAGAIGGA
jgi:hypothetical protein